MSRRAAEAAAGGPSPNRRRISARDVVIASPMRATMGPRAAAAPFVVTICKWANKAAEVFPAAASQDVPVWQLQIVHDSRPSVTFGFLAALRGYLPEIELESMDELEQRKNFRVVIAAGQNQDPDGVGVEPWRVAMYAASSTPVGPLEFLAGFVQHVAKKKKMSLPSAVLSSFT